MDRKLPVDLVDSSLEATARFAATILPLLKVACDHVKKDVENLPPGGRRVPKAERQLAPPLIRLRMHQLIQGHNSRLLVEGKPLLETKNIRNGAVCLQFQNCEYRLLKESNFYPTKPSGKYQQQLISQEQYWRYRSGDNLFGSSELGPPLLNGLIYYQYANFELYGAHVVIPSGFDASQRVIVANEASVPLPFDLEDLARFESTGVVEILAGGRSRDLVLSQPSYNADAVADPYAEAEADSEEVSEEPGIATPPFILKTDNKPELR